MAGYERVIQRWILHGEPLDIGLPLPSPDLEAAIVKIRQIATVRQTPKAHHVLQVFRVERTTL